MRRALATLALSAALAAPAEAARHHTSGFETNNFTSTEWNATVGSPTIQTGTVHSGTYAMQSNVAAATAAVRRDLSSNDTAGTHYFRFYFRCATRPNAAASLFETRNNLAAVGMQIRYDNSNNTLELRNLVPGTPTQADFTTTIAADTWYRVELETVLNDTTGSDTARLYEGDSTTITEEQTLTAQDTLGTNINAYWVGVFQTNSTANCFIDDAAWNDETGGAQTTWAGPGKIAMLVPTAEGATINYTPLSGTDNALMVDELPGAAPDDATTYNSSTTATHVDRLVLGDLPAEVTSDADILLVSVGGRVGGNGTTGSPTMRFKLWDEGGTLTDGPTNNKVDINGWQIITTAEYLTYNAGTKTKANIDSFEAGYGVVTDTSVEQRVTAMWVNVEWIEAPAAPDCVPTLTMLGVGRCG